MILCLSRTSRGFRRLLGFLAISATLRVNLTLPEVLRHRATSASGRISCCCREQRKGRDIRSFIDAKNEILDLPRRMGFWRLRARGLQTIVLGTMVAPQTAALAESLRQ
jgi:hypothetical protein